VANLQALLNATLSATDTTLTPSVTIITRNLNNPALNVTTVSYDPFLIIGTTNTAVLPSASIVTAYVVYLKNLHATNNVLVNWQPTGGGANNVSVVAPGGVLLYFQTTENAGSPISSVGNGIVAMTLSASGLTTPVEILLAG
jgi:hypothetical protein